MTTPDPIDRLSQKARDNIEIIGEGFDRGETQAKIQERLRKETGSGIRQIDLSAALRLFRGEPIIQERGADQRFTESTKSPDPTRAALSKGPILRRFSYNVGIIDTRTGEIIGAVQVSSNTRRTVADLKAQAAASVGAQGIEAYADDEVNIDEIDEFEFQVLSSLEASETIL